MKPIVMFVLRLYKRWLSPMLPAACRYVPSCSDYAAEAIERRGVVHGAVLALGRVLRCHPFSKGGYDPVPSPEYRVLSSSRHIHVEEKK